MGNMSIMRYAESVVKYGMTENSDSDPVKEGETILLLVDDETDPEVWQAFFIAFKHAKVEPIVMLINKREHDYQNPPDSAVRMMKEADGIMYLTSTGMVHSLAGQEMSRLKKKNFFGEHITLDNMSRGWRWFTEDVIKDWKELNGKVRKATQGGKLIHITSPQGTDITVAVGERPHRGMPGCTAFSHKVCALVPSEAHIGLPNKDAGNGILVADLSVHHIGALLKPMVLTIKEGKITNIDGGLQSVEFAEWLKTCGDDNAWVLGELAVGTNKWARFTGSLREDRKIYGTCHLGFGQNLDVGGTIQSKIHWDVVLSTPTITVDGKCILEKGKFLI